MPYDSLGALVRARVATLREAGVDRASISDALGGSGRLGNYEHGHRRPRDEHFRALMAALQLEPSDPLYIEAARLCAGADAPEPSP